MDQSRGFSVRSGRIILLGDGTEVIPDQPEEELFEENHTQREPDSTRNEREGTPGPQVKNDGPADESSGGNISESPSSTAADSSSGSTNAATEKSAPT